MLIWLEYDSIAFAVMALGIGAVELLAWSMSDPRSSSLHMR